MSSVSKNNSFFLFLFLSPSLSCMRLLLAFLALVNRISYLQVRDGWQTGETLGEPGMSLEVESNCP